MLHDLRFGFRMLRRNPAFALAAIFTLALGIGAATLIFSVGAALLLDAFPYQDAGRLVRFYYHSLRPNGFSGAAEFPLAELRDFRATAHNFEDTIGFATSGMQYIHGEGAQQISVAQVTTNTFAFLGVAPLVGRAILPDDANPAAPEVCVVSYRFWQEQLHGDPAAIGTTLTFNGEPLILAGVMPPRFEFLGVSAWMPFRERAGQTGGPRAALQPMARLKKGVALGAASAEVNAVSHQFARQYPQDYPDPRFSVSLRSFTDAAVGGLRPLLYSLFAAVAMLLLIASSNAANLLLARASAREREIAIRAAAGATRGRLVRQLLVESAILAAVAGVLGCLVAAFALTGLRKLLPPGVVPREAVFGINQRALWFAVAITAVTTLLCGLAPALHAARKQFVPRAFSAPRAHRLRGALVIAEAALSVALLTGAGLMIRTFFALTHVDLGFDPANTLQARLALPRSYTDAQRDAFSRHVLDAIRKVPGVRSVGVTADNPGLSGGPMVDLDVPGAVHSGRWNALIGLANETYFQTMHRPVREGRDFTAADLSTGQHVTIVNQAFVRAYLSERNAIGRRIVFHLPRVSLEHPERPTLNRGPGAASSAPPDEPEYQVIGVVADARNAGIREPVMPQVYLPLSTPVGVVVRTAVPPRTLAETIRRSVWAIDPEAMLTNVSTVEDALDESAYAQPRFALYSIGGFAAIGLLLVASGVFGVMAYQTTLRTREIGIRMALGAEPAGVFGMVLASGLRLIGAGVAIGVVAALALTRLLASQLWGVSPFDPVSFAAAALVLLASGAAACYLPARRAARLDPMEALRCE